MGEDQVGDLTSWYIREEVTVVGRKGIAGRVDAVGQGVGSAFPDGRKVVSQRAKLHVHVELGVIPKVSVGEGQQGYGRNGVEVRGWAK